MDTELAEKPDAITKLRIRAIVLESYLESLIKEITRLHFNDESNVLRNKLSFDDHLEILYKLEILSKDQKEDMKTIVKIRGFFAHRLKIDDESSRKEFRKDVEKLRIIKSLTGQTFSNTQKKFEACVREMMTKIEVLYEEKYKKYKKLNSN